MVSSVDPSGAGDGAGYYVRVEGDRAVLLDVAGRGRLANLWCGNPSGTLRVLVDDRAEPAVQTPMADLGWPRFAGLSIDRGFGVNQSLDVSFEKRVRVEAVGAGRLRYQIGYVMDPPAQHKVEVPDPPARQTQVKPDAQDAADKAAAFSKAFAAAMAKIPRGEVRLAPGERQTALDLPGPGTVADLRLLPEPFTLAVARGLRVQLTWDDAAGPSLDLPLADLYAMGLGMAHSRHGRASEMRLSTERFVEMPYRRRARLVLTNTTAQPMSVRYVVMPGEVPSGNENYVCLTGRAERTVAGRPFAVLDAQGSGEYLGCSCTLLGDEAGRYRDGVVRVQTDGRLAQGSPGLGALFGLGGVLQAGASRLAGRAIDRMGAASFTQRCLVTLAHGGDNSLPGQLYRTVAWWRCPEPRVSPAMPAWEATPPFSERLTGRTVVEAESLLERIKPSEGCSVAVREDSAMTLQASGGRVLAFDIEPVVLPDPFAGQAREEGLRLSVVPVREGQIKRLVVPVPVPRDGLWEVGWRANDADVADASLGERPYWRPAGAVVRDDALGFANSKDRAVAVTLSAKPRFADLMPDTLPELGRGLGAIDYFWLREVGRVEGCLEAEQLTCTVVAAPAKASARPALAMPAAPAAAAPAKPATAPPAPLPTPATPKPAGIERVETPLKAERSEALVGGCVPPEAVYSGNAAMRLRPGRPGDRFDVAFPVPSAGSYGLWASCGQGPSGGQAQVLLDGQAVATIDTDGEERVGARWALGTHRFSAPGEHHLTFVAKDGGCIDLDYLLLRSSGRAMEAESLVPSDDSPGRLVIHERSAEQPQWSGDAYVTAACPGSESTIEFPLNVPRPGYYRVSVAGVKVPPLVPLQRPERPMESAVVAPALGSRTPPRPPVAAPSVGVKALARLDDVPLGVLDCRGERVAPSPRLAVRLDLSPGAHRLVFAATEAGLVGLDTVELTYLGIERWKIRLPIEVLAAAAVAVWLLRRRRRLAVVAAG
ncbi:MAG: DUF2961 domain-containing protein [Armatimonadetes bacterium]|nr:DUF2961 domain-containing protein [Armatimonadota bacterium]